MVWLKVSKMEQRTEWGTESWTVGQMVGESGGPMAEPKATQTGTLKVQWTGHSMDQHLASMTVADSG